MYVDPGAPMDPAIVGYQEYLPSGRGLRDVHSHDSDIYAET
jgi:hypothetical protein